MKKIQNKQREIIISSLIFFLGVLYFVYTVSSHSRFLFKKFNPATAEKKYSESQWQQSQNIAETKVLDEWAIAHEFTGWKNYVDETRSLSQVETQKKSILKAIQNKGISDSFLYSYVGYKYSMGSNPSLLNPEHPPLAKYLIGYSILTFGGEHIVGIGIAFFVLLLVAIISFQISRSLYKSSFAFSITSFFPLFTDQIRNGPQLEIYQLFFFLLLVHFLLMWEKKKKYIFGIGAGVVFGMLLSTKTLLPFLTLFSIWLLVAFWKEWKLLLSIFLLGAISFCLTYFSFFTHGGTMRSFLGLQKYIVTFYGHASIPYSEFLGNYLRLIFTGWWKFWDSSRTVSFYSQWNLLWPIIFVVGMYKLRMQWIKYSSSHLLIWFIIFYNVFVFIIPVFPRYLLLLFVPLIIVL